jgi:adenosylcobinamide-phosphate synthase
VLLVLVGGGFKLRTLRLQARKTPSPNSGWPMAAMALILNVSLHKPGVYVLNAGGREPQVDDTARAIACASKVLAVLVVIALTAILLIAIRVVK